MSAIRYTSDHEWVRAEEDGTLTVGITAYAQEQLGDVVFVDLPEAGRRAEAGEEIVVIESVKAAADVKMPIGGEIVAVNEALADAPETVNESPLEGGWFLRIQPEDDAAFEELLDDDEYARLTGS